MSDLLQKIHATRFIQLVTSCKQAFTLISPLADFTATVMTSMGLSELPFFTEPTVTNQIARLIKFGVV
jgi:hypothetical protein